MEIGEPEGDPVHFLAPLIFTLEAGSIENILLLVLVVALIACSALISGSEVAFFSFNSQQIQTFGKGHSKSEHKVYDLINQPRYLLATILIANNLVNVAFILVSNHLFEAVFDLSPKPHWPTWLANLPLNWIIKVPLVTAIIVLFGEVLPKVYATARGKQLALFMAQPLTFLRKLFMPIAKWLVNSTQTIENRLTRRNPDAVSAEDIDMVINLTTDVKSNAEDVKMLKSIVRFGDILVKDIMTARPDIIAIKDDDKYPQVLETIKKSGFSRIPIYDEKLDNIKSVLYTKDLLKHLDDPAEFKWQKLARKPHFVPENKRVDDLLEDFQSRRLHIALVVDEYGGTVGLITLEDILEEVIGEINDEYDDEYDKNKYKKIAHNTYLFEGKVALYDACKIMGVDFNQFADVKGDSDSMAGLVLELAGEIPHLNDKIFHHPFTFTIVSVDKKRIKRIKVFVDE